MLSSQFISYDHLSLPSNAQRFEGVVKGGQCRIIFRTTIRKSLLVIGMIMICFAPVFSTIASMKRFSRLLLAAPCLVLLIGCDNASSTTANNDTATETTPSDSQKTTDLLKNTDLLVDIDNTSQDAGSVQMDITDEAPDEDKKKSLLAMAKSESTEHSQRSPMISELNEDSTLQATLMGDYVGMLPCSFCDNTNVTLNLFADGTVTKTSVYNNPKPSQAPLRELGIYRQDKDMITIVYQKKNIETYHIQDNHLIMVDGDNNPNDDYTLSRQ